MRAQPRSQHVKTHLRTRPTQGIHEQTMNDRARTGYSLQPLRLQIAQTHRDIGAKAEAESGDPVWSIHGTFSRWRSAC